MIKKEDKIVTFKLISGENIVAVLRSFDESSMTVEYPFLLRSFPKQVRSDRVEEILTANAFCSMAADRVFTFKHQDLMFVKEIADFARPFYLNLYRQNERLEPVDPADVDLDDYMDVDEMKERLDALLERMGMDPTIEEEEEEVPPGTIFH